MAISYTEAVRQITTEAVFARGIKYYLFKKIKSKENLLLPFWRLYTVKGESNIYYVKLAIADKLVEVKSNQVLAKILEQNCSCSCQYFLDYGICKHIVACLADIENEFLNPKQDFKLKSDAKNIQKLQTSNILDNILGIEQSKKEQDFIYYLFKPNTPSYLTREMVLEIEKLDKNYDSSFAKHFSEIETWLKPQELELYFSKVIPNYDSSLLNRINKEVLPLLGFYAEEKKIFSLVEKTVYFWQQNIWLWLVCNWMRAMTFENKAKIHYLLFRLCFNDIINAKWKHIYLENLGVLINDENVLNEVIDLIQTDFGHESLVLTKFNFAVKNSNWILDNLENLPNDLLFKTINILPEEHDKIDLILKERITNFVDFLPTDTKIYTELSDFLHLWRENLGYTENQTEILKQIRTVHVKKKSLIQLISDL